MVEKVLLKLKALAGTVGAVAADEVPTNPVSMVRPATVAAETLTTRFFPVDIFILPLLFARRDLSWDRAFMPDASPRCRW
jgi:hypothetical protein